MVTFNSWAGGEVKTQVTTRSNEHLTLRFHLLVFLRFYIKHVKYTATRVDIQDGNFCTKFNLLIEQALLTACYDYFTW